LLSDRTLRLLACPRDQHPLIASDAALVCSDGHRYPVIDGIPILLRDDVASNHWALDLSIEAARKGASLDDWADPPKAAGVHPYVQKAISATGGNLYRSLVNRLPRYPVPEIPLEPGRGRTLVDIGCNWGRWTIAAAQRGYHAVGMDPYLEAVLAAHHVCAQLGVAADFVVADARYLPFRTGAVETAFSYSVFQHFSKPDARTAVAEIGRVLTPGGRAVVQMPNMFGVRCLFHQAKRGFREPREFEVRYWSPRQLRRMFESVVGPARLSVDGFFSLNAQLAEADLLPPHYRALVHVSAALARLANRVPPLIRAADSLYVTADRRAHPLRS
jgi:SAM-dependent methyltransferase